MNNKRIASLVFASIIGLTLCGPAAADEGSVTDQIQSAWAAIVELVVNLTDSDDEDYEGGVPDIQPVPDPIG